MTSIIVLQEMLPCEIDDRIGVIESWMIWGYGGIIAHIGIYIDDDNEVDHMREAVSHIRRIRGYNG